MLSTDISQTMREYASTNGLVFENSNTFHHEFIGQYVEAMGRSLQVWDRNFGTGLNLGDQYYKDMAYARLFQINADGDFDSMTQAFLDLVPSSAERNRIKDLIVAENKSLNSAKGNGKCDLINHYIIYYNVIY